MKRWEASLGGSKLRRSWRLQFEGVESDGGGVVIVGSVNADMMEDVDVVLQRQ